ncbi:uncharacterized protein (TIGR02600 family) [Roseimicrobium gellanilyticum]|uniref:Uncharacterized protein (TIGR02600 family) n=2 Tax=Roseimicrobium gellanilyticum TaxID=748857 RepID=A0A366HMW9_9BACT|nr:uncharacterized protein (TIGR02600 family) [Roseimicrobium gellanilyticum]
MVVAMLGLITVLVLALYSLAESELKGARHYSSGQQSRQISDVAVDIVISQLRKSTTQSDTANGREIWTSQPGLVRRYATTGKLQAAYKLYSSSQMALADEPKLEDKLLKDVPPSDWTATPERYVDLNQPVVRTNHLGQPRLLFPVIDPRAMSGADDAVHGFKYTDTFIGGSKIQGVVTQAGDGQRLPMPVEWIYVLKDGSLGTLDPDKRFTGRVPATKENPIVGRVAFWTDDESSKVNINTASEPTFWAPPTFFHDEDASWARYQPVNGEFQRYPGHPATTALSPILFPEKQIEWEDKELIYGLVPKIGPGGTKGGTVSYDDPKIEAVNLSQFRKERLYASLDEFLLKEDRTQNDFGAADVGPDKLQRTGFFLTARSRAPESNPFGLPKIATWPGNYRGPEYRSKYDTVIAFCATLAKLGGKRQYMFQRGYADSPTMDVTQADNQALLNYLLNQWQKPVPGFSDDAKKNFNTKYGEDLPQILVEIFDYIRSVNLHDGYLADPSDKPANTTANFMLGYQGSYTRPIKFKTFTDPRFIHTGADAETGEPVEHEFLAFPGHGQVTPSVWTRNGKSYEGIARFPTITEAGLHFICAADNTNDPNNPFAKVSAAIGKPGGGSAPKLRPKANDPTDRWYSNFPPNPVGKPYGPDVNHPGYQKPNWNWQLEPNKPLPPGKRRIQARFLLEFFIPAAGYTIIEPEFSVKVKGLKNFKIVHPNGTQTQLFPNEDLVVRTGRRATHVGNQETGGYGLGLKGFLREREAPARAPMPADNQWGAVPWQVKPSSDTPAPLSVLNYDLISNFVDIEVGEDGSIPMLITGANVELEIYSGHLGKIVALPEIAATRVQTLQLNFPSNTVKAPTLVRVPIEAITNAKGKVTDPEVEAPYWWTFYGKGCMGFDVDSLKKGTAQVIGGRFWGSNSEPQASNQLRRGAFFYGFDPDIAGAPRPFRPKLTPNKPAVGEEAEGSDVVQTMLIKHGDYRLTAASPVVDASQWKPHRNWGSRRLAHNFSNFVSQQMPGYDYGGNTDYENRLVPNKAGDAGQKYANNRIPDFPFFTEAASAAHSTWDFDNGTGPARDGPYINKPDEGNLNSKNGLAYFVDAGKQQSMGENFFSPNRQIPSPAVLGSLPTGVKAGKPWRTLLFRPQEGHPGGSQANGGQDPPDHLFLEFFWMPVVEPYAISEPFSTAGKINLNYQIFPFTNIRRASGLHAVLEKERLTAVNKGDMSDYKAWPVAGNNETFWKEQDGKTWHRKLDIEATLKQFDQRFNVGRAFITPSEICDIHLIPVGVESAEDMPDFWADHRLTGDNTRERPYANIYPRLTTRSNTFKVHYVAQSMVKARSTAPDVVDNEVDKITSEHRGSTVIERYLDPAQKNLPDFTSGVTTDTLDQYHQFRVIETKKFGS